MVSDFKHLPQMWNKTELKNALKKAVSVVKIKEETNQGAKFNQVIQKIWISPSRSSGTLPETAPNPISFNNCTASTFLLIAYYFDLNLTCLDCQFECEVSSELVRAAPGAAAAGPPGHRPGYRHQGNGVS